MTRRALALTLASIVLAVARSTAGAAPDDPPKPAPPQPIKPAAPPAAPAVPGYFNPAVGITVEAPPGWTVAKDKGGVPAWKALATFTEPQSGALAILSARRATAITLSKLRAEVTQVFADDATFRVASINDIPTGARIPLPGLLVDATQARAADPPPAGTPPPALAPPPVTYRVHAAYYLGGDTEYLLYIHARFTLWSRLSPVIDKMYESVAVRIMGSASSPRGEGAYGNEVAGFSCKYPPTYGVRVPQRDFMIVEFAPAGEGPVIGVYRYNSEHDLDGEAKALKDYYTDEVGGDAETGTTTVAGLSAALVTAHGRVGGKDQCFFVAVVKRGNDTFRCRVAAPKEMEAQARPIFDAFLKTFVLTNR